MHLEYLSIARASKDLTWQGKAETVTMTIHGKFVLFGGNAANTLREWLLLHLASTEKIARNKEISDLVQTQD